MGQCTPMKYDGYMFKRLSLSHWRQFETVDLEFSDRLTVLTGENGTGKTTILSVLSKHFGWNIGFVSLYHLSRKRKQKLLADAWDMYESDTEEAPGSLPVGRITYSDESECVLLMPPPNSPKQYQLTYKGNKAIHGIHIPSHTPSFSHYKVDSVPVNPLSSAEQYQKYRGLLQNLYLGASAENPGREIKRSLISLAVFAGTTDFVQGNPEYQEVISGFQNKLQLLLPRSLGFERLVIDGSDIVFETSTGRFSLDAVSGGVGALVGIAWQVYMYCLDKDSIVVTIDEPETHLHPSMQRELLPNLSRAFPTTQFVVATHSPFIIASVPEAHVYALTYGESRRVSSELLTETELAGTANEILREILGVPLSVPIWVEERLVQLAEKYEAMPLTAENLLALRRELQEAGLRALLPEALDIVGRPDAEDS